MLIYSTEAKNMDISHLKFDIYQQYVQKVGCYVEGFTGCPMRKQNNVVNCQENY
jgi:hypothetical protein